MSPPSSSTPSVGGSKRETRLLLILASILILVAGGSSVADQWRHDRTVSHSDSRWADLQMRLGRVERACKLSEAP